MILMHNTATVLEPRFKIFNLFKWLWKCQDNPFAMMSSDVLDLRIYFDRQGLIRLAHGLVTLGDYVYTSEQFKNKFCEQGRRIRIMLERGTNEKNILRYKELVDSITGCKVVAMIKSTGEVIRNDFEGVRFVGLNYEYWHYEKSFSWNLKRLWKNGLMTMRKWSCLNNGKITDEMRKDENVIYEVDFY